MLISESLMQYSLILLIVLTAFHKTYIKVSKPAQNISKWNVHQQLNGGRYMGIIYSIYSCYNKAVIREGRKYLINMPADDFYNTYLKKTIEKYPDFRIIKKNSDTVEVVCYKRKRAYFFKYHRCGFVTVEQYEMFLNIAEKYGAKRAFYMTPGGFDHSLVRANWTSMFLMDSGIFLIDGIHIIKKIMGLRRKWSSRPKRLKIADLYIS